LFSNGNMLPYLLAGIWIAVAAFLYRRSPHGATLYAILILAVVLRLDSLAWALPRTPHPDESRVVDYVIATAAGAPEVVFSDYGSVPFHLLRAVGWSASMVLPNYSLPDAVGGVATYILARFLAGMFGVGTVALVYVAGCLAYDRKVGLIAAAFLTFTVLAIQLSHSYTVDVILVFWTSLFLVIGLWLIRRPRRTLWVALAIVTGVALATKIVALFLLLPLAVALYLSLQQGAKGQGERRHSPAPSLRFIPQLVASLAIVAATFAILTPAAILHPFQYWWLDFQDPNWWHAWNFPAGSHRLLWNLLLAEGTVRPLWAIPSTPSVPLVNPVTSLLPWAMGPALLAMAAVGVIIALKRHTPSDWFLLCYLFGAYLAVANSNVQFIRYVYPMVPVLAILGARPVMLLSVRSVTRSWPHRAVAVALMLTLLVSSLYSLAFASIYQRPDTRLQAEEWIKKNIPPGSMVGLDGPDAFADPVVDQSTYRIHALPLYQLYDYSTLHTHSSARPITSLLGSRLIPGDNMGHVTEEEIGALVVRHLQSDYLIITNRLAEMVGSTEGRFEKVRNYYQALFGGRTDYQLVKTFSSQPQLWRFTIDDSRAEHTFKIFDHPTIYIFKRVGR